MDHRTFICEQALSVRTKKQRAMLKSLFRGAIIHSLEEQYENYDGGASVTNLKAEYDHVVMRSRL